MPTRLPLFAAAGLTLAVGATSHAALVVQYDYTGTPGTAIPNPTLDGAVVGDPTVGNIDNGTLGTGVTYQTGDSRGGLGTHVQFTGEGVINFTDDSDPTDTRQDALTNVAGATAVTDFRITAGANRNAGAATEPRLIFISSGVTVASPTNNQINTATNAARLEVRLTDLGDGTYTFRAGGRSIVTESFQSVTSTVQTIADDTWNSLATVFDYQNDTIDIFLNGESIVSNTSVTFANTSTGDGDSLLAQLGRNSSGNIYVGDLDNTQIYNTALDDATVAALTTIPEPASLALLALGALCLAGGRRRLA